MTHFNQQIVDEAAEWAVRVDAGPLSEAEKAELAAWLKASPIHLEEFMLAAATLAGIAQTDPDLTIDIAGLLDESGAEIVALSSATSEQSDASQPQNWITTGRLVGIVSGLAAAIGISIALWLTNLSSESAAPTLPRYQTALGEQRSVQLEDGTLVHINTQSELSVAYSEGERRIDLVRGEALFDVYTDPDRPFRVTAGGTTAEALGTVFNVRLTDEVAVVSVVEGKVKVDKVVPQAPEPAEHIIVAAPVTEETIPDIVLSAGERASVLPSSDPVDVGEASIEAMTSWRERKLVFESDSLDTITSEFNRYNRMTLVVTNETLAAEQFSGVFDADDPESFVEFLEFAGGVETVQTGREIRLEPKQ